MENIELRPVRLDWKLLQSLEKRGLVRALRPTKKLLKTRTKTGTVDTFYVSSREFGPHKLIGVGKRSLAVKLEYHGDNEEFILVNPSGIRFKPLYLIMALEKDGAFSKKAAAGRVTAKDLIAVELVFNDPKTCVFTMLKGTVHCEVTVSGTGQHPVFFVSEPFALQGVKVKLKKQIKIVQDR